MSQPAAFAGRPDDQLAEAQQVLDLHATSSADGRCLACGTIGPCHRKCAELHLMQRGIRSADGPVEREARCGVGSFGRLGAVCSSRRLGS